MLKSYGKNVITSYNDEFIEVLVVHAQSIPPSLVYYRVLNYMMPIYFTKIKCRSTLTKKIRFTPKKFNKILNILIKVNNKFKIDRLLKWK